MVAPLVTMGISAAAGVIGQVADALSPKPDANAQTRKTADDFETMFLEQSLNRLTQDSGEEGPLGSNGTNGIHRSMLVDSYAKQIVKTGGVGIADQIYRQMLQMQEAAQGGGHVGG